MNKVDHDFESHSGVPLIVVCPRIAQEVTAVLEEMGEADVAQQLKNVVVIFQNLNGDENSFSFMAYPVPRLSAEQRLKMELVESRNLCLATAGGSLEISLDDFGQINWFYIRDIPTMHQALIAAMRGPAGRQFAVPEFKKT